MPTTAGPLAHATLLVSDAAPLVQAYSVFGLVARGGGAVSAEQAAAWGQDGLAGSRVTWLAPQGGPPLLRLIECPAATPRPTRFGHGWLALEILVREVDALAAPAQAAGFDVVGPLADLEMSPMLRAMQLVGPAGEMLYLTQVKGPLPPFDLPLSAALPAAQAIGPLFIGVMSTPSRAAALAACAPLQPASTLQFETKVSVLNRAFGHEISRRWPLATVALAGQCLLEIDEVNDAALVEQPRVGVLPAGLAWLSLRASGGPALLELLELSPGAWIERLPP